MDWSHELLASLIWLGKAFIISVVGLIVTTWALCRFTVWGRQFRRLAWPWFKPSRSVWPLAALALIIFMSLFSVRLNVLLSFWRNGLYTAIQKLDAPGFWSMIIVFAVLATIHVGRSMFELYVRQSLVIHWRAGLTDFLVKHWLTEQNYYRSRYVADGMDNPDQRIQQDANSFVTLSLDLAMGLLEAVVSLLSFTIVLWALSGSLSIFGFQLSRAMVFLAYLYVIVATIFAVWIGRPLIQLSFLSEKLNANFRYALVRMREYGESISFFRGESVENKTLTGRFASIVNNMWGLLFRRIKLQGFNLASGQAAVIFPMIVQAPRLFSKEITLGDWSQTNEAFNQVQDALSFFREAYDDFASYRAVLNRLSGFLNAMDAAEQLPAVQAESDGARLAFVSLSVRTPDHVLLLENLDLSLSPGAALLIRGPSGAGKTTLLRAVSGLWPFATGKVIRPQGKASLFLPQKPYLPLGTLRAALYYPDSTQSGTNADDILRHCQLGHLVSRLDEEDDWTGILSLGEQQRLAIGRALLAKPQVLFLDEASSAMDEGLEHGMYRLLRASLPDAILVSVGHRSSLLEFHTQELEMLGEGRWQMRELVHA
ncbi:MAG: transporter ATP-binding protein [Rhodocyclales bacterium]|nr:transporter ATP-binding protein [Rhodocyclales bacterium]